MKKRGYIILAGLVLIGYAMYLFVQFVRDAEDYGQTATKADAIVVLTGGKGRAREGLNLLRKGAAGILIISGVNKDAGLDSIFLNNQISGPERSNIILEKNSRSTFENAIEVRKLMEGRGLKSMVLITSVYHMKRALYIFKQVMPADIIIGTCSVRSPSFDEKRLWFGRSIFIFAVEFLKYYWYVGWFSLTHSVPV
jgi:uncharacterized SAM-binding protein YcdF (DUF218 family)